LEKTLLILRNNSLYMVDHGRTWCCGVHNSNTSHRCTAHSNTTKYHHNTKIKTDNAEVRVQWGTASQEVTDRKRSWQEVNASEVMEIARREWMLSGYNVERYRAPQPAQ
jgi:hypothetical protein